MPASTWLILLSVALYGLVHSLLASLQLKIWARQRFGPSADRSYRLIYNLFAVVSLLPIVAMVALFPDQPVYRIPYPWTWFALAGQGLALLALAVGVLQTGAASFLGIEQLVKSSPSASSSLVESGMYAWVRHPLYTAGLVLMWLTPVMTVNLLAFYAGLTAYILVGMHFEERKLMREFGPAYAEYCRRTPALIPGFKAKRRSTPTVD